MPNKKSAIKRARQNEKRRTHNRAKRSTLRSAVKKVFTVIEAGSSEGLTEAVREAQSKLGKAAKVNLIKKNKMRRAQSRLMKAANKASQAQ